MTRFKTFWDGHYLSWWLLRRCKMPLDTFRHFRETLRRFVVGSAHHCLLNRLFRRRSKKTSKRRVTGLCAGNSPGPVNSPHKWPVTRKMFPFDDVIMKAPHYWPLWGKFPGERWSIFHSSLQGPVMWKVFPRQHIFMVKFLTSCWQTIWVVDNVASYSIFLEF